MITAHAVHTLLTSQASLLEILTQTLMWGGDTDSVASIAWGIASARYGNEILPEFFERDLEVGRPYGVSYLKSLGTQLMSINL
jgi:ADP-ribosylglycohydrolase